MRELKIIMFDCHTNSFILFFKRPVPWYLKKSVITKYNLFRNRCILNEPKKNIILIGLNIFSQIKEVNYVALKTIIKWVHSNKSAHISIFS